jgi:hypothetical protein
MFRASKQSFNRFIGNPGVFPLFRHAVLLGNGENRGATFSFTLLMMTNKIQFDSGQE